MACSVGKSVPIYFDFASAICPRPEVFEIFHCLQQRLLLSLSQAFRRRIFAALFSLCYNTILPALICSTPPVPEAPFLLILSGQQQIQGQLLLLIDADK